MARILVIEDEASIRSNLMRFVGLEGHEAIEAAHGRLEEALRLGATGYVTKPFNFSQLRALLLQHLPEANGAR